MVLCLCVCALGACAKSGGGGDTATGPLTTTAEPTTQVAPGPSITDISDWAQLGIGSAGDSQFQYLLALLSHNTSALEQMTYGGNSNYAGVFDNYKTLAFGAYSLSAKKNNYGSYDITLNIKITSSGVESLPAGDYSFLVQEGISGMSLINLNLTQPTYTPAETALNVWFAVCLGYEFPDYATLSGDDLANYNYMVIDYLNVIGADTSVANIAASAKKYLNIDNFAPDGTWLSDGKYYIGGHGGSVWFMQYTGEREETGYTVVTAQFFADPSMTEKSHTVEYRLQDLGGGEYMIAGSTIVERSNYEPYRFSV